MLYQSKRWKIEDDLDKTGLRRTLVFFNLNNDVNIHLLMFFELELFKYSMF